MCREEESSDDDSEDSFARDDALQFEADEGGAQEQMAAAPKGDVDMLLDNFRMKVPPEPATAPKNPSYTQFLQAHFTQQQIEELHLKQRQKEAEEQARVLRLQAEQRQAAEAAERKKAAAAAKARKLEEAQRNQEEALKVVQSELSQQDLALQERLSRRKEALAKKQTTFVQSPNLSNSKLE